jgi:ribose transport system substrate-binding protein
MKRNLALSMAIAAIMVSFGATGSGWAADLDYFNKQLDPFRQKPTFAAPGPSFNAVDCMKGKSIFSIPVSSTNAFTANIEKAMQNVAQKVSFKFTTWENQGQPSQWVQGFDAAINQKADLIDLLAGADPRVLVPEVGAARDAKIPVVASHYNGVEQSDLVKKYVDEGVPIDYHRAGGLLLDWAVVSTKGNLNALVLTPVYRFHGLRHQ